MSAVWPLTAVERQDLRTQLGSCIQCGLCLPHCATYLVTGDETQSPRGRLLLLEDLVAGDAPPPSRSVLDAFDLCLGCRACVTACPGGIVPDLLDRATALARAALPRPAGLAAAIRPERMTILRRCGEIGEAVLGALLGTAWRRRLATGPHPLRRLARLLGSRPASPTRDEVLTAELDLLSGLSTGSTVPRRLAADQGAVTLFAGCASRDLLPGSQSRLCRLLESVGVRVETPGGQTCCGALEGHGGDADAAAARHAANDSALARSVAVSGRVLVEAAGCGLELIEAGAGWSDRVVDAVALLDEIELPPPRTVPLRVAVHDPCHAWHGQGLGPQVRCLLAGIPGLQIIEARERDVCCGSGGVYALRHPELSEAMGRRKAGLLAETGANLVVTTNPGCLGQIRDALLAEQRDMTVLLVSDLLWYSRLS